MKEEPLEVAVDLTNQKVQFTGVSISNPDRPIIFDYKPPWGDGQGFTGLELLLLSLSGCSATAVVYLLRKLKKNISGMKVIAKGIRRDTPPLCFQRIFLEFELSSPDAGDADLQKAIELSESTYCPVWAMLKNNVEVVVRHRIVDLMGNH